MAFYSNGKGGFLGGGTAALDLTSGGTIGGNVTLNGNLSMGSGNQILADVGTLAAPGVAFNGEAGSGMYRPSAGSVSLVRLGAERANIDSVDLFAAAGIATSVLDITSGLRLAAETIKTINYNATNNDAIIVMNGATLTLTLPASPTASQLLFVKNINGTNLTVARNGQTIDGAAADDTVLAGAAQIYHFISGSGWYKYNA